jgi:catechol-2,3-dioxygenase
MAKIRGLAEVVLWVHDIEKSLAFYRDLLDLAVISPSEMKSPVFLQVDTGRWEVPQMVVLVQLPTHSLPFTLPRTLHHLALEIAPEDFEAEKSRLERIGYKVRTGRHPVIPSRTMYIDDPDGNEVELICRA